MRTDESCPTLRAQCSQKHQSPTQITKRCSAPPCRGTKGAKHRAVPQTGSIHELFECQLWRDVLYWGMLTLACSICIPSRLVITLSPGNAARGGSVRTHFVSVEPSPSSLRATGCGMQQALAGWECRFPHCVAWVWITSCRAGSHAARSIFASMTQAQARLFSLRRVVCLLRQVRFSSAGFGYGKRGVGCPEVL